MERIDQIFEEVHAHAQRVPTIEFLRRLETEKKHLQKVSLLSISEEIREKRIRGILNYCEDNYKRYCNGQLRADRKYYILQVKNRIDEIVRDKIVKLDDIVIELENSKDIKGLELIRSKRATIW